MDTKIEIMEAKAKTLEERVIKECVERLTNKSSEMTKRFKQVQEQIDEMPQAIENAALERVTELLSENIYDVIPGYQDLEDQV